MCSSALRQTLRISIRANRQCGCLRIIARLVITAHAVLPGAAFAPHYSCSCRNITRPVQARPGISLLISHPSTVHKAADRKLRRGSRRTLLHLAPRSVRRCHPIDQNEVSQELMGMPDGRTPTGLLFSLTLISLAAAFQKNSASFHDCEFCCFKANALPFKLGTTTRRLIPPSLKDFRNRS
jgi:hypothetical protein